MKTLLLIDDEISLTQALKRRFDGLNRYSTHTFERASAALDSASVDPVFAIFLDLMMEEEHGIDFIARLQARFAPQHLIVMTGYASIATTVEALRRGATDYVAKPVRFNELLRYLESENPSSLELKPMTAAQAEWEHIQRILALNEGNVSATAKMLGMHRRSLQRKLQKHAPRSE